MAAWRRHKRNLLKLVILSLSILGPATALARPTPAPAPDRTASIVVEAASGRILAEQDADASRHPASLAKLMTLYMTFEALRDRRVSLDQAVPVSDHAASMIPTKLGVPAGGAITVEQAILSMVTLSANDSASALAELLGGSEDRFAQLMTVRARALGMSHTIFQNASGLPDPDQWTTARDLSILARHLIADFPNEYRYFSTPSFVFHGRVIFNHNTEMQSYPGADGLKTGYIQSSGHNLVTSAVRDGVRLIGVEFGAPSNGIRDQRMTALLNAGYQSMGISTGRSTMLASRIPSLITNARAQEPPRTPPRPLVRKTSAVTADPATWTIQVGSFRSKTAAREAAIKARKAADSGEMQIAHAVVARHATWRAQITGLTGEEAHDACSALARRGVPCIAVRASSGSDVTRG